MRKTECRSDTGHVIAPSWWWICERNMITFYVSAKPLWFYHFWTQCYYAVALFCIAYCFMVYCLGWFYMLHCSESGNSVWLFYNICWLPVLFVLNKKVHISGGMSTTRSYLLIVSNDQSWLDHSSSVSKLSTVASAADSLVSSQQTLHQATVRSPWTRLSKTDWLWHDSHYQWLHVAFEGLRMLHVLHRLNLLLAAFLS